MTHDSTPAGYRLGDPSLPASPIGIDELAEMKASLLFDDADVAALRRARPILEPQTEAILDVWYGFVGSQPHLLRYFSQGGRPNADYLAQVRARFGRWISDTTAAEYDDAWLAYQHEIGRRHHRVAKNRTDGVDAAEHIHFRHLILLTYPIFATLRPFLEKGGDDAATVDAMHHAWLKSVLLQVTLWSHPYVQSEDY